MCKSTVNLAFLRLQPKNKKIQKIQQGTKNEGKRKEARQRQTNQWLIMLSRLPEEYSKYKTKMRENNRPKQRQQLNLFNLLHIVR